MLKFVLLSTVVTVTTMKLTRLYKLFAQARLVWVQLSIINVGNRPLTPRLVGSEMGRTVCFIR